MNCASLTRKFLEQGDWQCERVNRYGNFGAVGFTEAGENLFSPADQEPNDANW